MMSHTPTGPAGQSVFVEAAKWIQDVLLGPASTSVAVIAIASTGLLMLSGRVDMRRGATIILGCFILFGAAGIGQGLRRTVVVLNAAGEISSIPVDHTPPPPLTAVEAAPEGFTDPYAGASLRR